MGVGRTQEETGAARVGTEVETQAEAGEVVVAGWAAAGAVAAAVGVAARVVTAAALAVAAAARWEARRTLSR